MFLSSIPTGVNPLSAEQAQKFDALVSSLTPVQQAWVSGYLAASAQGNAAITPVAAPAAEVAPLTVLYGSQTGNAKHVAQHVVETAKKRGLNAQLVNMADYKPARLKDEKFLTIVVSTYGEGEPPEPAEKLYNFLASKKAPKLDQAKIAILGLGDSSYEQFCQTAIDFEERLTRLGASVVVEKALLDVDYDDHTQGWIDGALDVFEPDLKADSASFGNVVPIVPGIAVSQPAPSLFNKKNPFEAEINLVQKITGRDSTKDVRHIEISLEGSGLTYKPGDALGVYFKNDPTEIDELLQNTGLSGTEDVSVRGETKPLRAALLEDFELTQSYPGFVEKYAQASGNERLTNIASDKGSLRDYLADRQIFDIVRDYPAEISADALVDALRGMQPRLYSIASSQAEVEDEVHLTVGVVDYDAFSRPHLGGASGHLARRSEEGDALRVFVEENDNFRLPASSDTPVIMIGPGTGIAPFRSFLQERDAAEASGKNWLFFGNPHFTQDFLYQVELQAYLKSGLLTKLSVAFSRDQSEKVYVQDRLLENGKEVYSWLEDGAHIYLCGDATRMAKDVNQALLDIIAEHGNKDSDAAQAYLEALRDAKRYQKDVY